MDGEPGPDAVDAVYRFADQLAQATEHDRRRRALTAAHGAPDWIERGRPTGDLLRLLGVRAEVHPRDVVGFTYRDMPAAKAWTGATARHHGVPCLGLVQLDGPSVAGAYDLRPVLALHRAHSTDPARPDDWHPPWQ